MEWNVFIIFSVFIIECRTPEHNRKNHELEVSEPVSTAISANYPSDTVQVTCFLRVLLQMRTINQMVCRERWLVLLRWTCQRKEVAISQISKWVSSLAISSAHEHWNEIGLSSYHVCRIHKTTLVDYLSTFLCLPMFIHSSNYLFKILLAMWVHACAILGTWNYCCSPNKSALFKFTLFFQFESFDTSKLLQILFSLLRILFPIFFQTNYYSV